MAARYFYVDSNHGTNTGTTDTSSGSLETGAMSSLPAGDVYDRLGRVLGITIPPTDTDVILLANDHDASYDNGGPPRMNEDGALDAEGLIIISVDTAAIDEYLPGASDILSDTADEILIYNNGAIYGLVIGTGDDGLVSTGSGGMWNLVDVTGKISGSVDRFLKGSSDGATITATNLEVALTAAGASVVQATRGLTFRWNGGKMSGTSPPLFLDNAGNDAGSNTYITGVDLSIFTGTFYPTPVIGTQDRSLLRLTNCLINSGATLTGTLASKSHRFEMFGCDTSTNKKLYRFYIEDGIGTAKNNDSVYVTAGETWYEGTDHSSIQVDTKANCSHIIPFVFELPAQYIDLSSGTTDVLTIDLATAETLVKHDLAAFLIYPDGTTATLPIAISSGPSIGTDYGIDPLDTSTTMPASALGSGDWTGSPGANRYELVLDTSGTPGQATAVSVRIEVYKASIGPIYIHPLITVSAT